MAQSSTHEICFYSHVNYSVTKIAAVNATDARTFTVT